MNRMNAGYAICCSCGDGTGCNVKCGVRELDGGCKQCEQGSCEIGGCSMTVCDGKIVLFNGGAIIFQARKVEVQLFKSEAVLSFGSLRFYNYINL